jgi:hypothetical protein
MINLKLIQVTLTDPNILAFLTWIGIAVGMLGLLLSYYFYRKSLRSKRPYCLTFTHSISPSVLVNVPDLHITYKGSSVPTLSVTKLVFWNAGSETINAGDVPNNSPFSISIAGDGRVLNFNLDFVKKNGNGVALSVDETHKKVTAEFDYFDKNDGFVVELLHTGESDDDVKIEAIFKGAHDLVHRSAAPLRSLPKSIRRLVASEQRAVVGWMLILAPIATMLSGYFHVVPDWFSAVPQLNNVSDYMAAVVAYGGSFVLGVNLLRTRLPAGFTLNWQ